MLIETGEAHADTPLLRPAKVAEKLDVSLATIWRWARTTPDFPKPIKIGARVTVFKECEVDAFIARKGKTNKA